MTPSHPLRTMLRRHHDCPLLTLCSAFAVLHPDRYAIGGLIYLITSQDLSLLGYPQSVIMQQLALYWLSGDVQSNMSSMGASPLLPSYVSTSAHCPSCPCPNCPILPCQKFAAPKFSPFTS